MSLNPSVDNTLQAKRKPIGQPARCPVVCSKIRTLSFDGQTTKFEKDNVFMGEVPDRLTGPQDRV